jgi:hypothetical protein
LTTAVRAVAKPAVCAAQVEGISLDRLRTPLDGVKPTAANLATVELDETNGWRRRSS